MSYYNELHEVKPIQATLEDYKRIKTRGAWQIVLEVPEEKITEVFKQLGTPINGESIHVAIVRLKDDQ